MLYLVVFLLSREFGSTHVLAKLLYLVVSLAEGLFDA